MIVYLDKLLNKARSDGDHIFPYEPASNQQISALELEVGFELPNSYKRFLRAYGGLDITGSVISGILTDDPLERAGGNFYSDTLLMREEFKDQYNVPDYLWVIHVHEDGAYCFNTKLKYENGEYAIVNYEPYLPEKEYLETVSKSFEEFILGWYFYVEEDDISLPIV